MARVTAMDYSAADYTDDRIRALEREVTQLKDEIRRTRVSAGTADGRPNPGAPARVTRTTNSAILIKQKNRQTAVPVWGSGRHQ